MGGSVRDAFLDRSRADSDIDVATDARPDVIERVLKGWADAVWLQGEQFGTVGADKDGDRFEITTFRAEVYRDDSRNPHVTFSDNVTTDLSRRDFTINAIAIALDEPELFDPHDGLADLGARRLRTPLSPEVSFGDDPLRMFRAARFAATLGFEPDADLLHTVEQMRERLRIIERGADTRRTVEAPPRRRSVSRAVADRAHEAGRRVLA